MRELINQCKETVDQKIEENEKRVYEMVRVLEVNIMDLQLAVLESKFTKFTELAIRCQEAVNQSEALLQEYESLNDSGHDLGSDGGANRTRIGQLIGGGGVHSSQKQLQDYRAIVVDKEADESALLIQMQKDLAVVLSGNVLPKLFHQKTTVKIPLQVRPPPQKYKDLRSLGGNSLPSNMLQLDLSQIDDQMGVLISKKTNYKLSGQVAVSTKSQFHKVESVKNQEREEQPQQNDNIDLSISSFNAGLNGMEGIKLFDAGPPSQ